MRVSQSGLVGLLTQAKTTPFFDRRPEVRLGGKGLLRPARLEFWDPLEHVLLDAFLQGSRASLVARKPVRLVS